MPRNPAELVEIQAALGEALSAWSNVETALSMAFRQAVAAPSNDLPAAAAFAAVLSYEVQLAMTTAAVHMQFKGKPKIIARWSEARKHADALRTRRNKLAHGSIVQSKTGHEPTKTRFMPFWRMLHPADADRFEQWSAKDITGLAEQFRELSLLIWGFVTDEQFRLPPSVPPPPSPAPGPPGGNASVGQLRPEPPRSRGPTRGRRKAPHRP